MCSKEKFFVFLLYWYTSDFFHIADSMTNSIEHLFIVWGY